MKDMQTDYDTHVANIVYVRRIREQDEIVKSKRVKFRKVNEH